MNKICTSQEQSQKLIELGIDVNTADMYWNLTNQNHPPIIGKYCVEYGGMELPAWSLTALFNMLPKSARLEKGSSTELFRVNLPVELKCSDWYLDPIDAAFEIVCLLKKEEYI